MSAVVPPAAPPVPPSGAAGAVVALQIVGDGKTLAALPGGALLDAVAQARAAKGVIEAMTAAGPVQLKALPGQVLPAIPEGAKLMFQVVGQGGEMQLRLLAINGRPLLGAPLPGMMPTNLLAPNLLGGTGTAAGAPAQSSQVAGQPAPGVMVNPATAPAVPVGLTATVIRPAGTSSAAAPTILGAAVPNNGSLPADLAAGTQLTVRIAGMTPPGSPVAPNPATPGPLASPPAATPPTASGNPAAPTAATPAAPPPAPPAAPAVAQPPAPPTLHGTVIAQPPGGQAVVQTPIGTLALATTELPVGTGLRLEVVGPPQPPTAPPAAARPEGLGNAGWPALAEATAALADNPQALDQLMRVIPHAGPRLAASLSVFAAAQRSGDVRGVLGEGGKALDKAGRKDLADRLKDDLESLAADSARPLGNGEWRGYTLPFVHGGFVDPIRLYVRGGGEDERRGSGGTGNDQRFVLDFSLSNLGRLQLDGLVRREDKLFDLIIRTGAPLAEPVRRDIMAIFTDASELAGTKGGVSFHSGGRWVEPLPDAGPTRIEA